MAKSPMSLKLLIDTQAKKVLFAEANKDCVDFLFHILSLPMATVVSLLKEQGMVGSIGNLYESLEKLEESYIQPNQSKDTLLKPVRLAQGSSAPLLLLNDADAPSEKKFYKCGSCGGYNIRISDDPRAVCPSCDRNMTTTVPYVAPPAAQPVSEEGGFVKGVVTYMVMDNLVVKPMSTISCISLLNKFNIKEVGSVEEKEVDFGMHEALSLLKASLQSQNVLNDVFLKRPMAIEESDVGTADSISINQDSS